MGDGGARTKHDKGDHTCAHAKSQPVAVPALQCIELLRRLRRCRMLMNA